jgi:hypothetical protein
VSSSQPDTGAQPPRFDPPVLTVLTTEHFALQGARGATIADSSSRAAMFLSSISGTLLALSLLSSATGLGRTFLGAAVAAGVPLLILGLTTFVRVLDCGLEDALYARAINRIRSYYFGQAPELRRYVLQSDRDDLSGMLANVGIERQGRQQAWFTTAGSVGLILSVLLAWWVTGILALLRISPTLLIIGGTATLAASAWTVLAYQRRAWAQQARRLDGNLSERPV